LSSAAVYNDIDMTGIENEINREVWDQLQLIDQADWHKELAMQDELFFKLYANLPKELVFQRELLVSRL